MDNEERRNRKWIYVILGFFTVISLAPYRLMNEYYIYISAYMWFGIAYGMCLQYGRFCFASAFRDLFAVRVPRMVVGIMIAMVFFSLVGAFATTVGASSFHPAPFGVIHVIIAGAIFGVGMVIAGGCASGSLYKIGEGNGVSMLVVLALSVSQAIFVDIGGWANKLVPQSWHDSALRKGLPKVINVGDGWMDQYLAGYVWNKPPIKISETQVIAENFGVAKYFVGDSLLNVIIPAVLLLIVIYIFWSRKIFMRNRIKEGKSSRGFRANLAGYWSMIVSSKRTAIAGLALGIFAGLHMFVMRKLQLAFGVQNFGELMTRMGIDFGISVRGTVFDPGYWYVTTQEAQWVGWMFNKLGWNNMDNIYFGLTNGIPNPLFNPADWMSLGLIGGAMIMALANKEFRWKKPTKELAMWAIIGGTLMGIGSRLALGCNVGAFFVRVSMGDPSGWMFGIGMVGGAYTGVKFFNWWTERKMAKEMEAF